MSMETACLKQTIGKIANIDEIVLKLLQMLFNFHFGKKYQENKVNFSVSTVFINMRG